MLRRLATALIDQLRLCADLYAQQLLQKSSQQRIDIVSRTGGRKADSSPDPNTA